MSELGYLYVLANSAMPGVVKVGKTTRSPLERAGELSGATGLPTPFIVVYEQLFQDCHSAESFVHTYLAQKGHRVSDNREFFSAPTNIVIRAIGLAPGAIDDDASQISMSKKGNTNLKKEEVKKPWVTLLSEAQSHYHGNGDHIQDHPKALKLFKQASKLGALPAYRYIAEIYYLENEGALAYQSSARDRFCKKLLEIYKEGASKGSAYCLWETGMILMYGDFAVPNKNDRQRRGHHPTNEDDANKCFSAFVKRRLGADPDGNQITHEELQRVFGDCSRMIRWARDNLKRYPFLYNTPIIASPVHSATRLPIFIKEQINSLIKYVKPDDKTSRAEKENLLCRVLNEDFIHNNAYKK